MERQQQLLDDLEAAQLEDPAERSRLENEENRLAHGVRLQEGVMTLMGRLVDGAEEAPSVLDHLAACEAELSQMQQLDGSVSELNSRFGDGFAELQDFIRELDRYGSSLESDPDSLGQLQERIALLKALERRHGKELSELIVWRDQLREQLVPGGAQASLEALEQSELQARRRDRCNGQLTQARRFAAAALEQDLMQALRPMGLANVRFEVAIEPMDPGKRGQMPCSSCSPRTRDSRSLPLLRWPRAVRCPVSFWR